MDLQLLLSAPLRANWLQQLSAAKVKLPTMSLLRALLLDITKKLCLIILCLLVNLPPTNRPTCTMLKQNQS